MAPGDRALSHDSRALLQRAVSLLQSGQPDRALDILLDLDTKLPGDAQVCFLLGAVYCQRGDVARGIAFYDKSIALEPRQPLTHSNKGNALWSLGRHADALGCYEQAIALKPDFAEAQANRGIVLRDLGRSADALASFDRAIALKPDYAPAFNGRGGALCDLGRPAEGLLSYERAIALRPDFAEAHNNRGNALQDLGRPEEALASYDRAIALKPGYARAHSNRGNALADLGRTAEALASYDRAIALSPDFAEAHNNRGTALRDLGRHDEAIAAYDRAIALKADYADARWNKAICKLLTGELAEGFALHESRWQGSSQKDFRRNFREPLWLGDAPIAGKTILVYHEQGLGDAIQFCRYVPLLERLGAKVVLEVPASLAPLLASLPSACDIVEAGRALPPFDVQCPLLSLPLAFRTTLETIPAEIPYLFADAEKTARWKQELGAGRELRVGLVWSSGHDERRRNIAQQKRRDIPLVSLRPLALEGVDFYSLQLGAVAVGQLRVLANGNWGGPKVHDLTAAIGDFSDTAALIANLDLVITVCTSVAHLAGALGKPTWVLLQQRADWRWLLERSDSPWYPTVTLFRQSSFDDWTDVVAAVRERLIEFAASRGTTARSIGTQ